LAKIVFISPIAFYQAKSYDLPLGLLNLASVLRRAGHQVEILNFSASHQDGSLQLGRGEEEDLEAMRNLLLEREADLLGFSTFCFSYHISLLLARAVKERRPELPIVLGGPQASLTAALTLQAFPWVDAVALGEAERTIERIVRGLLGEIPLDEVPGLAYRQGESVRLNEAAPLLDLEDLPQPDYGMVSFFERVPSVPVETGRGCPFSCRFCSTKTFWRRACRPRQPASIVAEMARVHRVWGRTRFVFVHDLFTSRRQGVIELCNRLETLGEPLTWSCSARLDGMDELLAERMVRAGCRRIFVGLESGSPRVQALIGKAIDIDKGLPVLETLQQAGVETICSLVVGFPGEKEEDLRQTLALALRLCGMGCDVTINRFAFLPQTELTEEFHDQLVFDGSAGSFGSGQFARLSAAWIGRYPQIFPFFYTVDDPIRRMTDGLDRFFSLFYQHLRSYLPDTWRFLLECWDGDLLGIFLDFRRLGLNLAQTPQGEAFSLAALSWEDWTRALLEEMERFLAQADLGSDGWIMREMFRYERDRFDFQHHRDDPVVMVHHYQAGVVRAQEERLSLASVPRTPVTVFFHRERPSGLEEE
jgi:radical SAM superfamily enzyme YgiQ (UPF0313 family)